MSVQNTVRESGSSDNQNTARERGGRVSALTAQDYFLLDQLLRKYKTLPIVGAHGFLTASLCLPEEKSLSDLLPFIFGGTKPMFQYDEENTIATLLHIVREDIKADLHDVTSFDPLDFLKQQDAVEAHVREDAFAMWCLGFLHGLGVEADYWQAPEQAHFDEHIATFVILAAKDDKDNQARERFANSLKYMKNNGDLILL